MEIKHIAWASWVLLAVAGLGRGQAPASRPLPETQPALARAVAEFQRESEAAKKGFETEAEVVVRKLRDAKLPAKERLAEIDRVKEQVAAAVVAGRAPEHAALQSSYGVLYKRLIAAREKASKAFDEEADKLLRAGDDAGSLAVLAAIDRVLGEAPEAPVQPDATAAMAAVNERVKEIGIRANVPRGFNLGPVRRGDIYRFRYVSGKWSSHQRRAAVSPDDARTNPQERLVICDGTKAGPNDDIIATVPGGTVTTVFEWKASRDYADVFLRVNDNDFRFDWNKDEGVVYQLERVPPR